MPNDSFLTYKKEEDEEEGGIARREGEVLPN